MRFVIGLLAGGLVGLALLYLFAPRVLFRGLRALQRRRGGLVQRSVRVEGASWPYLEAGPVDGEVVVLVHGFGGDKDNWTLYAPYLKDRYRVIACDLPGFGENDRSLAPDHSGAAQARRVIAFLDALGIERCHLGGNSMGGLIALHCALEAPARLASLTLFNNAGVLGPDASELQQRVEQGESPLVPHSVADVAALMRFVAFKPLPIPGRFYEVMWEEMRPHQELLQKIFGEISGEALEKPLNDRLGEVRVPSLIVWGRHDRLLDVSVAEVQHRGIAGSELVIFEEVGHVPMIEKPAETAERHRAFLEKHRQAA